MQNLSELDREELFDYLIEVGEDYKPQPWVNNIFLVPGCTSNVWVRLLSTTPIKIECCAESLVVRGYCHLISELVNGKTLLEIQNFNITHYIETNKLGVSSVHTRANAFLNIWNTVLKLIC